MPQPHSRYGASLSHPSASLPFRVERIDERAARMIGTPDRPVSVGYAQRVRLSLTTAWITAFLTAGRDYPTQREDYVRRCKVALDQQPELQFTPSLAVHAAAVDAAENASCVAALAGDMTETERRDWCAKLRAEIAAKADLLRALEGGV